MKKGKVTMTITLGLVCFVLTCVMFMQFKIVRETDITSIETMREAELRTELANWKSKYEEANATYEERMSTIKEYQDKKESDEETSNLVEQELQQINTALGKTDVEGEGVVITLRDPENYDELGPIQADYLLILVNALKAAGAEAISINDERIINMTDIVDINESFIKINQQRVLAPYIVKAIGDKTYLQSGMIGKGGYVDELQKMRYDVSIETSDKITIYKYNGEIKTKYME